MTPRPSPLSARGASCRGSVGRSDPASTGGLSAPSGTATRTATQRAKDRRAIGPDGAVGRRPTRWAPRTAEDGPREPPASDLVRRLSRSADERRRVAARPVRLGHPAVSDDHDPARRRQLSGPQRRRDRTSGQRELRLQRLHREGQCGTVRPRVGDDEDRPAPRGRLDTSGRPGAGPPGHPGAASRLRRRPRHGRRRAIHPKPADRPGSAVGPLRARGAMDERRRGSGS